MHPFFKVNMEIRVAFEDVDSFNVVHNAKYFCFFERGRLEYLRHLGFVNDGPASLNNFEVVIVEHGCLYKQPAVFDDLLTLHLRVSFMKRSSFQFQYALERKRDSTVLTLGYTNIVYIDRKTLKPKPVKEDVRAAVEAFEGGHLMQNPGMPEFALA